MALSEAERIQTTRYLCKRAGVAYVGPDVTAPTVSVTAPNGGEEWIVGQSENITWTPATDNVAVIDIDLHYSTVSASGPWTEIATGEANDGSYAWTIPSDVSTDVWVRVSANDLAGNVGTDVSDASFNLTEAADTPPTYDANAVTPIARWDVVPYQRFTSSFKAGVVAFCKGGTWGVRFSINGGAQITVTDMAHNDRLDVAGRPNIWEYFTAIDPASYDNGEVITLDAIVYGTDGGRNELPQITLVADNSGTYRIVKAWVALAGDSPPGNDTTGVAGPTEDGSNPFASIEIAAKEIQLYRYGEGWGNDGDGGVIYLTAGIHELGRSWGWTRINSTNEWITVTHAVGGTVANTKINNGNGATSRGYAEIARLKIEGVGIFYSASVVMFGIISLKEIGHLLWVNDCTISGIDPYDYGKQYLLHQGTGYITNSTGFDIADPTRKNTVLARNVCISDIGNDSFVNCPLAVNCASDNIDPGVSGNHADPWQWYRAHPSDVTDGEDIILYGYRGTNLHYQGIMIDSDPPAEVVAFRRVAFVNVYLQLVDTIPAGGGALCLFQRATNHCLWWHCTLRYDGDQVGDNDGGLAYYRKTPYWDAMPCSHVDIRGNSLHVLNSTPASDGTTFPNAVVQDNNYVDNAGGARAQLQNLSVDCTTSAPDVDADGKPNVGSPLIERLTALVPCDVNGDARDATTAAGAYRGPAEGA